MTWHDIRGHDAIVDQFRRSLERGRLASTFLFVGPLGVGKRTFAVRLAQALLCPVNPEPALAPCGSCGSCRQVAADTHPDLQMICKPADKNFIPIELLIGDREHRMREGLCHHIGLKPFSGGRKLAIIDDADYLNQEGANCLLKTLEEPPPQSVLILIGTSEPRQLPTIRSRCQIVRFGELPREDVVELLLAGGFCSDRKEAECWAELGGGSVQRAVEWGEPQIREFREQLMSRLSELQSELPALVAECQAFVEEAGTEAAARRARLRRVIALAAVFYRQLMRALSQAPIQGDATLSNAVHRARTAWRVDAEAAARCLDRCLEAQAHVDANASPITVLECWLDDLALLGRGA